MSSRSTEYFYIEIVGTSHIVRGQWNQPLHQKSQVRFADDRDGLGRMRRADEARYAYAVVMVVMLTAEAKDSNLEGQRRSFARSIMIPSTIW